MAALLLSEETKTNTDALPSASPPAPPGEDYWVSILHREVVACVTREADGGHNPANISAFTGFIENFEYADLLSTLPFSESSFQPELISCVSLHRTVGPVMGARKCPALPWMISGDRCPVIWVLLKESFGGFFEDEALTRGAAISFYTITSIGPVLFIVVAIVGLAFGEKAATGAMAAQLQRAQKGRHSQLQVTSPGPMSSATVNLPSL